MLEQTFQRLNDVITGIKGNKFTSREVEELSMEIRNVLLGADIPYDYVISLIKHLRTRISKINDKNLNKNAVVGALLQSYIDSTFANSETEGIDVKKVGITTIGVFGSNGVGKTTFVAKLAKLLKTQHNKRAMCVSFDITRFAAQDQLKVLCQNNDIEFLQIVENGIENGIKKLKEIIEYEVVDILIVDYAGIAPDNESGREIWKEVLENINFDERIIVLDSTFGQNAVKLIKDFEKIVNATGFAVSKVDSDQKGGIFFSIKVASEKPIYYISTGEKIDDIIVFNKKVITDALFNDQGLKNVINSFKESNKEQIKAILQKNVKKELDYNDFLVQLSQIISFGKIDKILSILPHTKSFFNVKLSTEAYMLIKKWIAIINSMTTYERTTPNALNLERMNRIAKGAGVSLADILVLQKKIRDINETKN